MTDSIKRQIEHLLDEPGEQPEAGQQANLLRARLAATLSEGLGGAAAAPSDGDTIDTAAAAAFIDGRLTGAERDKLSAALAQRQDLRADLESAAALVQSIADSPLEAPKDLLARAGALLAPTPPPPRSAALPRIRLPAFWPARRIAWAVAAALVVVLVLSPAVLFVGGRFGGLQPATNGEPELTVAPGAGDDDDSPQQPSCEERANKAQKVESSENFESSKSDLPERKDALPPDPSRKDPCDKPAPNDGGGDGK